MRSISRRLATTALGLSLLFSSGAALAGLKKGDALPAFQVNAPPNQTYDQNAFQDNKLGVLFFFKPDRCKTCIKGLDQLKLVQEQHKEDMTILAIGRDSDIQRLSQFASGMGLQFPVAQGNKALFKHFSASLLPTTLLVGPDRKVLRVVHGGGKHIPDMLTALASNQLAQNKPKKARKLFLRASKSGSTVTTRSGIAYARLKDGKLEDAAKLFDDMAKEADREAALRGREGLAEVLFHQGKVDDALRVADEVLKEDPKRSMANLVRGKSLHAKGQAEAAEKALVHATASDAVSDFGWQKAEAHLASGNLKYKDKQSRIALKSFRSAADENPYFAEALTNQGMALKELGEPEKAMEVFQKLQKANPSDKLTHALLRQAQAAIAQKTDLEKRKYIDGLVQDLVKQFNSDKAKQPKNADEWTSPALAISVLGFQNNAQGMLMGRVGMESVLQDELIRALQEEHIRVVDRALLDKLLEELKLGSSDLADPDTALKLGRIMAARLIATGSVFEAGPGNLISMRLIDTETTGIAISLSEKTAGGMDPTEIAPKFAQAIKKVLQEKYPLKGRLALVEESMLVVNLGKKHGVRPGAVFNVMGQGKPIELNGRILGYRPEKLGSLKITKVDDLMAYGEPVERLGSWEKGQKIIQKD